MRTNIGPLHIGYNCVAWSSSETPPVGAWVVSDILPAFEILPSCWATMSSLKEENLVLLRLDMLGLADIHWGLPFSKEKWRGNEWVNWEGVGLGEELEEKRGTYDHSVNT